MEAIAELIGALIAALVEAIAFAVIAAAELLVSVFALAAELLLVAVIHGVSAAKERYRERKRMAAIDDRGIDNEVALIRPHEIDLGSPEDEINADDSNVPLRQSERQPRSAVRRMTQRIRQRRRSRTALTTGQTILLSSLLLLSVGSHLPSRPWRAWTTPTWVAWAWGIWA